LVLFGIQNRTFGPYLAANDKILNSLVNVIVELIMMRMLLVGHTTEMRILLMGAR
jgi:hypothetical protein